MDDVLARARDKSGEETNDNERDRPLHLGAVIAKPENGERDNDCRSGRPKRQPGQSAFVAKTMTRLGAVFHPQTSFPGSTRALACCGRRPRRPLRCLLPSWNLCRALESSRRGAANSTRGACAPQSSQSILLQTAIECAPAQTKGFGRASCVPIGASQRFLDEKCFDFFETHI